MKSGTIPSDSTIADIYAELKRPEEYVRMVLGNMMSCRRTHGNAFVRIGITGKGIAPHYRIGYAGDVVVMGVTISADTNVFGAFDGRNHREMPYHEQELREGHWSSSSMDVDAVQAVLGELRKKKLPG